MLRLSIFSEKNEFRIRNDKNVDFSRIFDIIVKYLFSAPPLVDKEDVEI